MWYFLHRSRQVGPLSFKELQATLAEFADATEVLVWRDGFEAWKRAEDVPELGSPSINRPPVTHETPSAVASSPEPNVHSNQKVAPVRPARFSNTIAKNWRGEYPLWVSYWIFGVLGNLIVAVIPVLAVEVFRTSTEYNPGFVFAAIIATWVGVLAVATWQLVGVWRSANRRIGERARLGKYAVWASLAKIAVVLGVIRLVVDFGNIGLPQVAESSRMAFMGDPDLPAYSIRVMRNGTEVEIVGGFKYGLTDDFLRVLRASRQIRVVHLNSPGGRIGEAERLNKEIRSRNLLTYTSSHCLSACTVAFAAGRERWILDGAVLGFHRPAFPGMNDQDLAESVRSQKEIFVAAGFDPIFVGRAMATPNKDMWKPSSSELLRAKAITAVSDGSDFAASGLGPDVTRESLAAILTKVLPVLRTMKERFPKDYDAIVDLYFDNFVSGQSMIEMTSAARGRFMSVVAAYRPLADNDVLVDLGRLLAEQYAAVGAKSPVRCYLYASGKSEALNIASDLPEALIGRESAISERILATAMQRPGVSERMADLAWEKVVGRLLARGFDREKLKLLRDPAVAPSRHADYCNVAVALFQEIAGLNQVDASMLMRKILSAK